MQDIIDGIRSLVRPFIVTWGFIIYSVCILTHTDVPLLLQGLVSAIIVSYFGERSIKRLKEK